MVEEETPILLFDLGGVLLDIDIFKDLQMWYPEMDKNSLKRRWLESGSVRRFELGISTPGEFAASFLSEWKLDYTTDEFLDIFASWPKGFFPGAPELLRNLRRRYRIGCFSNSNELHWNQYDGFAGHFDFTFSSHLLGAIKPDAEAFAKVLALCETNPEDLYFFDDSEPNVKSAEGLGIRAFHVDGKSQLEKVLVNNHLMQP